MYECPNCGGNLKFDIPSQQLACAFCGTRKDPYEAEKETDGVEQDYFEATVFTCPQCAGEILSAGHEAAAFCSFCGASTILSSRISKEKRPQYIIPFKKTKEDCKAAYAKKMRRAFFVPDELKNPQYIDGFRGIYMPYWSYQLTQNQKVKMQGKKVHREGDYIITDHYSMEGDLDAYYLGYSRDASSTFYDNISEALAPYDAKEMVNFTPSLLSGFYADTADVEKEVYLEDVMHLADNSSYDKICGQEAFRGYEISGKSADGQNLRSSLGTKCRSADSTMYPVWFLSYRKGDRVAYATVNGQTGKVVADMPIDAKKYITGSLILACLLFVLLNLFFTFKPTILMLLACILVLVSAMIYVREMKAIWRKDMNADDVGMQTKQRQEEEAYEGLETKKPKRKSAEKAVERLKRKLLTLLLVIFSLVPSILKLSIVGGAFLWTVLLFAAIVCGIIGISNFKKMEDGKKAWGFILSILTVAVAVIIRVINPVSDIYYYGGALLTLLAVLFNMIDIIRNYNKLAMRRLPQFDKQGGDDRA